MERLQIASLKLRRLGLLDYKFLPAALILSKSCNVGGTSGFQQFRKAPLDVADKFYRANSEWSFRASLQL